jgi:tRNA dimethylallyltransferase
LVSSVTAPRLIVLQGATGCGKTALALALAEALDGEIIGADSMQVFEHMNVGTAAPTAADRGRCAHHMVHCWQPDEGVSAGRWVGQAEALIAARPEQTFVVTGGTNLWIRLLLQGLAGDVPVADDAARVALEAEDNATLRQRLERVDPQSAAKIHPNDRYRMVRALAHFDTTGEAIGKARAEHGWGAPRYEAVRLSIQPPRDWLHERIGRRAELMYRSGLVEEAVGLRQRYGAIKPLTVLGYRDALAFADGAIERAEAIRLTARDTRRYARNQESWIRKEPTTVLCDKDRYPKGPVFIALMDEALAACEAAGLSAQK